MGLISDMIVSASEKILNYVDKKDNNFLKEEYIYASSEDMFESGTISATDGSLATTTALSFRTVNYYDVGISGKLEYSGPIIKGGYIRPVFYDKNYVFVSNGKTTNCSATTSNVYEVPEGAKYFKYVVAYVSLSALIAANPCFHISSSAIPENLISLYDKVNKYSILTFNTMPSDEVLMNLPDNTIFKTLGYYSIDDGQGSTYKITTAYAFNCQVKQTLDSEGNALATRRLIDIGIPKFYKNTINLAHFGLKNIEYSTDTDLNSDDIVAIGDINDAVISSIKNVYTIGASVFIPSGYWVFNSPIDLNSIIKNGQTSLIGEGMNPRDYHKFSSATNLIFRNLSTDDVAVSGKLGTLKDISIMGNPNQYTISFNRTKFADDPDNVISETNEVQAIGVKWDGGVVQNVSIHYFYTGLYMTRNNGYINNIYVRRCHYGVKSRHDNKFSNVFGWNVHTMFQATGALISVCLLRVDSCDHILELENVSALSFEDVDGDWCTSSLVHIKGSCKGCRFFNIKGRCTTLKAQISTEIIKTAADLTDDTCIGYGLIYLASGSSLTDSVIMMPSGGSNPSDSSTGYLTPKILLVTNTSTEIDGLELDVVDKDFVASSEYFAKAVYKGTTTKPWQLIIKNARGIISAHCGGDTDNALTVSALDYLNM